MLLKRARRRARVSSNEFMDSWNHVLVYSIGRRCDARQYEMTRNCNLQCIVRIIKDMRHFVFYGRVVDAVSEY